MSLSSMTKKGLALAIIGTTVALSVVPAEAQWRRGWAPRAAAPYAFRARRGYGPGFAAAAIGGIAAGALIAGATRPAYGYGYPAYSYPANNYPAYSSGYYAPAPVYSSGYDYGDEQVCHVRRKRVWVGPNTYTFRRVTVCN